MKFRVTLEIDTDYSELARKIGRSPSLAPMAAVVEVENRIIDAARTATDGMIKSVDALVTETDE